MFPGLLDHYLAKHGWDSQKTERLPPGHPRKHHVDNLDAPIPIDFGARGIFDTRARTHSTRLWARTHRRWWMLGALAASLLLVRAIRA
jgi:hypothetical protein